MPSRCAALLGCIALAAAAALVTADATEVSLLEPAASHHRVRRQTCTLNTSSMSTAITAGDLSSLLSTPSPPPAGTLDISTAIQSLPGCSGSNSFFTFSTSASMPTGVTLPTAINTLSIAGSTQFTSITMVTTWARYFAPNTDVSLNLTSSHIATMPNNAFAEFAGNGSRVVGILMSNSQLTSIGAGVFSGLSNLQVLTLSNSAQLATLSDGWLQGCVDLRTINLGSIAIQSITNLTFAGNLSNVTSVDLTDCPIGSIETGAFSNMLSIAPTSLALTNDQILCYLDPNRFVTCVGCKQTDTIPGAARTVFNDDVGLYYCNPVTYVVGLDDLRQCEPNVTDGNVEYIHWKARAKWALDTTYHVAPVCFDNIRLTQGTDPYPPDSGVQFSLSAVLNSTGNSTNLPPGMFINPQTGEILFTPTQLNNEVVVVSITAKTQTFQGVGHVGHLVVEVLYQDVVNPNSTGPGGRPCQHGGTPQDIYNGTGEFDGHYTCACNNTGFGGPNCDLGVTLRIPLPVAQSPVEGQPDALTWGGRTKWAIGRPYYIKPPNVTNATLSDGTPVDSASLRYSVVPEPDGLLIDPLTGYAQFTPRTAGNTTSRVVATYQTYTQQIATIQFDVLQDDVDNLNATGPNGRVCSHGGQQIDVYNGTAEFDGTFTCNCNGTGYSGPNCEDSLALYFRNISQYLPPNSTWGAAGGNGSVLSGTSVFVPWTLDKWSLGGTYQIAPWNWTEAVLAQSNDFNWATSSVRQVAHDQVTFTLNPAPPGFFINPNTAEIIGRPTTAGYFLSNLTASGSGSQTLMPIATMNFTVLPDDTTNAIYGPGGKDCNDPVQRVDVSAFDHSYTCDCSKGTPGGVGPNCEVPPPTATGGSGGVSTPVIAGAAGVSVVALLLIAAVLHSRYQLWREKHRPENLSSMQSEIVQSLGIGSTLDIGPNMFGVVFVVPTLHQEVAASGAYNVEERIRNGVCTVLSTNRSLNLDTMMVTIDAEAGRLLTIFQLPGSVGKTFPDTIVTALRKAASRGKITIGATTPIDDVCLAIPQRVPREVDRKAVVRLAPLGEGNFADVIKCEIRESRNIPVFLAAAKVLKASNDGARQDLLKEAALLALLDHPNVISLIGVVTVPRDIPALLLLQYCENGSLYDYLQGLEAGSLDTSILLTFCADACAGMSYLSSCRIVHRDVASRNILLDSQMSCLVSDFGMSTVLAGEDEGVYGSYAAYVKMGGELPVRWSSIEVLVGGKFSRASDVWAFGCFVSEVMTYGEAPYAEKQTMMEVTEFIKGGGKMNCPPSCPQRVYDEIMWPCWANDPKERPGFSDMYYRLLGLGAVEGAVAGTSARPRKKTSRTTSVDGDVVPANGTTHDARKLRGVSVYHLSSVVEQATFAASVPPWESSARNASDAERSVSRGRDGEFITWRDASSGVGSCPVLTLTHNGRVHHVRMVQRAGSGALYGLEGGQSPRWPSPTALIKDAIRAPVAPLPIPLVVAPGVNADEYPDTPQEATIWHTVNFFIKPAGASVTSMYDGELGAAYVDTLQGEDVGQANALLSYTWGYKLSSVVRALEGWVEREGRDPRRTYIWICAFCLNQHRMVDTMSSEELKQEFGHRVRAIGHILPMLEPWHNPVNLTRAWCLFELHTAITEGDIKIDVILTEEQQASFLAAMAQDGYGCIDAALSNIKSEEATATEVSDLQAIRDLVAHTPGGFPALNATVSNHLHSWFENNGTIRSARRMRTLPSPMSPTTQAGSDLATIAFASRQRLQKRQVMVRQASRVDETYEDDDEDDPLIGMLGDY